MNNKSLACKCYIFISHVFNSSYFSFFLPRDSSARSEFFKSCFLILAHNAQFRLLKRLLWDYCVNHASGALRKLIADLKSVFGFSENVRLKFVDGKLVIALTALEKFLTTNLIMQVTTELYFCKCFLRKVTRLFLAFGKAVLCGNFISQLLSAVDSR